MTVRDASDVSAVIIDHLLAGSTGGTLHGNGYVKDVSGHFAVGGVVPSFTIKLPAGVNEDNVHIVGQVLYDFVYSKHVPGSHIGFWLDDGILHVDIVNLLTDREEAIKLGKERGEIAIFDGTTSEDIRL